eukprot:3880226-Pyramimonas_sp.AAC.1
MDRRLPGRYGELWDVGGRRKARKYEKDGESLDLSGELAVNRDSPLTPEGVLRSTGSESERWM